VPEAAESEVRPGSDPRGPVPAGGEATRHKRLAD